MRNRIKYLRAYQTVKADDTDGFGKDVCRGRRLYAIDKCIRLRHWRGAWFLFEPLVAIELAQLFNICEHRLGHAVNEPLVLDEPIVSRLVLPLSLHLFEQKFEIFPARLLLFQKTCQQFSQG